MLAVHDGSPMIQAMLFYAGIHEVFKIARPRWCMPPIKWLLRAGGTPVAAMFMLATVH
jgi:hypothetical protein